MDGYRRQAQETETDLTATMNETLSHTNEPFYVHMIPLWQLREGRVIKRYVIIIKKAITAFSHTNL